MDFCHLVMVTDRNNNKFYDMRDLGDGTMEVRYGRIDSTETVKLYPISKWHELYSQKTRKGYKDVTSMSVVTKVEKSKEYKDIEDAGVRALIEYLRSKARDEVKKNYKVGAHAVTTAMVKNAQSILDSLVRGGYTVREFNDKLIELFTVIPRRMEHVGNYLAGSDDEFNRIIAREQSLLDTLAAQAQDVVVEDNEDDANGAEQPQKTILEAVGLTITPATAADIKVIKQHLGAESAGLFYKAWRVDNAETRKGFKAFMKGKGRGFAKKLFWHGSRTENWWSILRTGLKLRPTNVAINGKMFGNGIYFAPRAKKSIGYTSLRGSYWAGGSSEFGFMALYEAAYGTPHNVTTNAGCAGMDWNRLQKMAPGCSCLHAHAGPQLLNDEIIFYQENQVTIKYLVELRR